MPEKILSFLLALLLLLSLAIPAYAAPSNYTVTVSTDAENVKRGDVVTVNVTVSGAQFCAVDAELSYDTDSFECISSMSGWSDNGEGKLRLVNVKGSDGYWDDGKVVGTFKFVVKDEAPAGESAFAIGEDRNVFIVGDWAEGASSEPAKPLEANQLVGTAITVTSEKSDSEPLKDFGVISDDGNTVNMEAGYHIYSIPDSDNEEVVWKSSDESVVTVDETGLVTAVADGSAVIVAQDKDGNELEQRTIVVGEMPKEPVPVEEPSEQPSDEPNDAPEEPSEQPSDEPENTETKSSAPIVIAVVAVVAAVAAAVVILTKKQKTKIG